MPLTFNYTRRISFAETDMAGVMHFSNYFRLMEEAEHAMFRSMGMSVVQPREDGSTVSWPRIRVECEYRGPIRFEDEVTLHLTITRIGSKSVSYTAEFERDGRAAAHGQVTMVCCDMREGVFKSIDIPDDIRARFHQ